MASRLIKRGVVFALVLPLALVALLVMVSVLGLMTGQVMASWGNAYATSDIASVPSMDAALVLGTLPEQPAGRLNPIPRNRLLAAAELWRAGKVKHLIVSGNRQGDRYDEPRAMRDMLVEFGVPSGVIHRDFAGFRTVTSVVQARDIYGQKRIVIVSQRAHLDRAIYLARHLGVEAWGYDAAGPTTLMALLPFRRKLVVLYAYWIS